MTSQQKEKFGWLKTTGSAVAILTALFGIYFGFQRVNNNYLESVRSFQKYMEAEKTKQQEQLKQIEIQKTKQKELELNAVREKIEEQNLKKELIQIEHEGALAKIKLEKEFDLGKQEELTKQKNREKESLELQLNIEKQKEQAIFREEASKVFNSLFTEGEPYTELIFLKHNLHKLDTNQVISSIILRAKDMKSEHELDLIIDIFKEIGVKSFDSVCEINRFAYTRLKELLLQKFIVLASKRKDKYLKFPLLFYDFLDPLFESTYQPLENIPKETQQALTYIELTKFSFDTKERKDDLTNKTIKKVKIQEIGTTNLNIDTIQMELNAVAKLINLSKLLIEDLMYAMMETNFDPHSEGKFKTTIDLNETLLVNFDFLITLDGSYNRWPKKFNNLHTIVKGAYIVPPQYSDFYKILGFNSSGLLSPENFQSKEKLEAGIRDFIEYGEIIDPKNREVEELIVIYSVIFTILNEMIILKSDDYFFSY